MDYRVISTDDHLQEDRYTWTSRMSEKKWGDKVPQVRGDRRGDRDLVHLRTAQGPDGRRRHRPRRHARQDQGPHALGGRTRDRLRPGEAHRGDGPRRRGRPHLLRQRGRRRGARLQQQRVRRGLPPRSDQGLQRLPDRGVGRAAPGTLHHPGRRADVGRREGRCRGAPHAQARRQGDHLRLPPAVRLSAPGRSLLGPPLGRRPGARPSGELSPRRRRQHGDDAPGGLGGPFEDDQARRGLDEEHRREYGHHGDAPLLRHHGALPQTEDRLGGRAA